MTDGRVCLSRRDFCRSITTLGVGSFVTTRSITGDKSTTDKSVQCGGHKEPSENTIKPRRIPDEPAFTVNGAVDAPVYWIDEDDFESVHGSPWYIAVAYTDGHIELNKGQANYVNNHVIMHEYGHVLGKDHIDETIMAPYIYEVNNAANGQLSDVTSYIFERADAVDFYSSTFSDLADIAADYAQRLTTMETLGNAAARYGRDADVTGYYTTSWNHFDSHSAVPAGNDLSYTLY